MADHVPHKADSHSQQQEPTAEPIAVDAQHAAGNESGAPDGAIDTGSGPRREGPQALETEVAGRRQSSTRGSEPGDNGSVGAASTFSTGLNVCVRLGQPAGLHSTERLNCGGLDR